MNVFGSIVEQNTVENIKERGEFGSWTEDTEKG